MLGGGTHVVGKGETMATIARATYGSASYAEDLAAFNPDANAKRLTAGTSLALPKFVVPLLPALVAAEADESRFLAIVLRLSAVEWSTFLANLPQAIYERHGPMLARAELFRATGMSTAEMAAVQKAHMERKGEDSGQSVAEQMEAFPDRSHDKPRDELKDEWKLAGDEQRELWTKEFLAVRDAVVSSAPKARSSTRSSLGRQHGGGEIVWAPETTGATTIAKSLDWNIRVGVAWLAAKVDPARIHGTILHEMIGHSTYADSNDDYLADPIMRELVKSLPKADQKKAATNLFQYRYLETEIFAELYEWTLDHADAPSDHAFDTLADGSAVGKTAERTEEVATQLGKNPGGFRPPGSPPASCEAYGVRIERDARILPGAKREFRERVQQIFSPRRG